MKKAIRGRPKMKPGESKADVLTVRLTPEEMKFVENVAGRTGMSVSDFVRAAIVAPAPPNTWTGFGIRLECPQSMTHDQWERLKGVVEVLEPPAGPGRE